LVHPESKALALAGLPKAEALDSNLIGSVESKALALAGLPKAEALDSN